MLKTAIHWSFFVFLVFMSSCQSKNNYAAPAIQRHIIDTNKGENTPIEPLDTATFNGYVQNRFGQYYGPGCVGTLYTDTLLLNYSIRIRYNSNSVIFDGISIGSAVQRNSVASLPFNKNAWGIYSKDTIIDSWWCSFSATLVQDSLYITMSGGGMNYPNKDNYTFKGRKVN